MGGGGKCEEEGISVRSGDVVEHYNKDWGLGMEIWDGTEPHPHASTSFMFVQSRTPMQVQVSCSYRENVLTKAIN